MIAGVLLLSGAVAGRVDLSGDWTLSMNPDFRGNRATVECTLKQTERKISVKCGKGVEMNGDLDGEHFMFRTPSVGDDHLVATYTGIVRSPTSLKGSWVLSGRDLNEHGEFSAVKHH
jgi:hypothetical protein